MKSAGFKYRKPQHRSDEEAADESGQNEEEENLLVEDNVEDAVVDYDDSDEESGDAVLPSASPT